MTELALLSYNLRRDTRSDGPNRWRHRRDRVAATLRKADVAGLQEALLQAGDAQDVVNLFQREVVVS